MTTQISKYLFILQKSLNLSFVLRICLSLQNLPKSSPLNIVLMRLIANMFICLFFASFWSPFGSLVLLFWSVVAELGFLILLVLFFFFYVSVPLRFAFGFGNLCGFLFFFSGLGVYSVYARLGAMCNTARMLLRSWRSRFTSISTSKFMHGFEPSSTTKRSSSVATMLCRWSRFEHRTMRGCSALCFLKITSINNQFAFGVIRFLF